MRSFPQPELNNPIPDWIPYIASPGSITVLAGGRQFIIHQVPEDAIAIIANLIDFWNLSGETKRKLSVERCSTPHEHLFSTTDLAHGSCAYCGIAGYLGSDGRVIWQECNPTSKPTDIPHVRWQDIVSQLASIDYRAMQLRRELQQGQLLCEHKQLPKRNPGEEYRDQCPDCGYISYCFSDCWGVELVSVQEAE